MSQINLMQKIFNAIREDDGTDLEHANFIIGNAITNKERF